MDPDELIRRMEQAGYSDAAIATQLRMRGFDVQPQPASDSGQSFAGAMQQASRPVVNAPPPPADPTDFPAQLRAASERPAPPRPRMSALDKSALARTAAQGVTLGFGDELEAAIRAPFSDRTYGQIRQEADDDVRNYREDHPVLSFATELGSGLVGVGGAGKVAMNTIKGIRGAEEAAAAARAASGLSEAARAERGAEAATRSLGGRIGRRLGTAVGTGAAYGAGAASPGHRLEGGLFGGLFGGALGAGMGAGGALLRGVRRLTPGLERIGAEDEAGRRILRAILNDDTTPDAVKREMIRMDRLGVKPETIMELSGVNAKGLGEVIAQTPGRGQTTLTKFLRERMEGAPGRIKDDVDDMLLGKGVREPNPPRDIGSIAREATEAAAPYYEAVFRTGSPFSYSEVEPILSKETVRGVWPKVRELMSAEGRRVPDLKWDAEGRYLGFMRDGKLVKDAPSTRVLVSLKEMLGQAAQNPRDIQAGGKGGKLSRAMVGNVNELKDLIISKVPIYKKALSIAEDRITVQNAGHRAEGTLPPYGGRRAPSFMKDSPAQLNRDFSEMSDASQRLYRRGASRNVRSTVDNLRTDDFGGGGNYAGRIFGSENARGRFRSILPRDQAENLFDLGRRESRMFETSRDVLRGSPTARRLAQMADANDVDALSAAADIGTRGLGGMIADNAKRLSQRAMGGTPRVHDLMAERLTRRGPQLSSYLDELGALRDAWSRGEFTKNARQGLYGGVVGARGSSHLGDP